MDKNHEGINAKSFSFETNKPIIGCIYGAYTWSFYWYKKLKQRLEKCLKLLNSTETLILQPNKNILVRSEDDGRLLFFNGQQAFLMNRKGSRLYRELLKRRNIFLSFLSQEEIEFLIWCYLFDIFDLPPSSFSNQKLNQINVDENTFMGKFIFFPKFEEIKIKSPISIVWEVTEKCPYNCIFCHSDIPRMKFLKKVKDVSLNEAFYILEKLKDAEVFRIYFSGGEPLANNKFLKIYKKAKEYGFISTFTTNGVSLNKEKIEVIRDIINYLEISVHGVGKTYFKLSGAPQTLFSTLIKNLEICLKYFGSDNITLQVVVTKEIAKSITTTIRFYYNMGFTNFRLVRFIPTYPEMRSMLPSVKEIHILKETIEGLRHNFSNINIYWAPPPPFSHFEIDKVPYFIFPHSFWCPAGKFELCILSDATVIPCISFKRYKSNFICGNIFNENFENIWNAKPLSIFRNLTNEKINKCNTCPFCYICYSCRCVSYNWSHSLYEIDFSCYRFINGSIKQ